MFEIPPLPNQLVLAVPFTIIIFLIRFILQAAFRKTGPKIPPGPPGSDHAKYLQTDRWNVFKAWNEKYGNVASFYTGPQLNVLLGTMEGAIDLLEKAGETFSSRPDFVMGAKASPAAKPMQDNESAVLIKDLFENKAEDGILDRKHKILRRHMASTMFQLAYGRRVTSMEDPLVMEHDEVEEFSLTPLRKPLQWFSWEPERRRDTNTRLYMTVLNDVKKRMEEGTQVPCTTQWALERQKELGFDDLELSYALSSPWAAGIGTVSTAIEIAILAILHYPEAYAKVNEEMDRVVGRDRMPTFEDQKNLPYLEAFIKETMRWRLVTPTVIAHSSIQDYTYKGMFIPKDTAIYPNGTMMMRDPAVFPDGNAFKPERFLNVTDPRLQTYKFGVFGFGRRICPGMYVALQSLYIAMARMLWAFEVLPVIENGKPYIPDADDFSYGLVSYPAALKYRLVARSEKHKEIAMREAELAEERMAGLPGSY
ncbi:cytochrome P450 [Corynespora cassiicola Philippines]|uniref:Cytochrome P450 n=1 Tax=Corynespora cassiicola Philippines TaxID=1448308 RepID=A0A2T2NW01_CORCC|nr:cytochrome P450 [Corynespora cassiicola Philippines]